MTNKYYVLDDKGEVEMVDDMFTWARWFKTSSEKRRIARSDINGFSVSTVFLGLDHNFCFDPEDKEPILFETMVFDDREGKSGYDYNEGEYTQRYHTREEAEKGHEEVVNKIKNLK